MLNEKGQTLVELAMVLMLLLALLVGITEFSRAWNHSTVLTNGARSGARYAATFGRKTSFVNSVKGYTMDQVVTELGVPRSVVQVNMSAFSNRTSGVVRTLTPGGAPPLINGDPVSVIVRYSFTGVGGDIVPIIGGQKNFMRRATMRYEGN